MIYLSSFFLCGYHETYMKHLIKATVCFNLITSSIHLLKNLHFTSHCTFILLLLYTLHLFILFIHEQIILAIAIFDIFNTCTREKCFIHHDYNTRVFIIWLYIFSLIYTCIYFNICYLVSFHLELEEPPLSFLIKSRSSDDELP